MQRSSQKPVQPASAVENTVSAAAGSVLARCVMPPAGKTIGFSALNGSNSKCRSNRCSLSPLLLDTSSSSYWVGARVRGSHRVRRAAQASERPGPRLPRMAPAAPTQAAWACRKQRHPFRRAAQSTSADGRCSATSQGDRHHLIIIVIIISIIIIGSGDSS